MQASSCYSDIVTFYVMEYIVLSLIIISWEGECVPRLVLLFS